MKNKWLSQFVKKYTLVIVGLLFLCVSNASAQKYAYVNTQYILENIPDYKAAQQQLDNQSITWQKEIEDKYAIIDKLYKAYQAEQALLTDCRVAVGQLYNPEYSQGCIAYLHMHISVQMHS